MIPLPIRDENPSYRVPMVTMAIIGANVLSWLFQLAHGVDLSALDYGAIPAWVLDGRREGWLTIPGAGRVFLHQEVPQPMTVLTSMFMHGSWMHIIGNMWFLWIFGDNIEDAMGHGRFVAFYLLCGLVAAAAQIGATPASTAAMVGASGAVAGILGGYARLYPRARIRCLWVLIIFITTIDVPAWLLLTIWFVSQFLLPSGSGIAWMAHVGGFVAGLLLARRFIPAPPGWSGPRLDSQGGGPPRLGA